MTYRFDTLSPADFEDLVLDLIGRALSIRFEAFATGPDGGIDGRHAKGGQKIIIQAKHYVGSTFPSLKNALKKERTSIDSLGASRYILATSRPLTPQNKADLAQVIGNNVETSDIFAQDDLNLLLRSNPDLEKAHVKLWLSSTAVLERLLNAAHHSFNEITREELESKLKVYAKNPSLGEAQAILEEHHVLIVSGPPGVGKTTLAQMLAYAYMAEGWELTAIRSLSDGLAHLTGDTKKIFFFDDFLGRIALDAQSLASKDNDLFNFISKINRSANFRFILTTRAYILEDARRMSEHLSSQIVSVTKFVLDVGMYTRRIKARILYNHLYAMGAPAAFIDALLRRRLATKIIDHKNYNPRIIEDMTSRLALHRIKPDGYPDAFIAALDNPDRIWDTAFRTHITRRCQHLIYSVYFSPEHGVLIEDLEELFNELHTHLCREFAISRAPNDFEESLRILEGSFITIKGRSVSFVNPSVRDYLSSSITDINVIEKIAASCKRARCMEQVWKHANRAYAPGSENLNRICRAFIGTLKHIVHNSRFKKVVGTPNQLRTYDASYADRLQLLVELWDACRFEEFGNAFAELCDIVATDEYNWGDGGEIVDLIVSLREEDRVEFPNLARIIDLLESMLVQVLKRRLTPDELESTFNRIDDANEQLSQSVSDALFDAVEHEIHNASDYIYEEGNPGSLDSYADLMRRLGDHCGIRESRIMIAEASAKHRAKELREEYDKADAPDMSSSLRGSEERFSDADVENLFASLRVGPE